MNKFRRTLESLSVLLIVILSIPAVSESSNIIPQAAAQIVPNLPAPPTGLTTPFVYSSQISTSWHAPLNGVYPVTGYQIERSTDNGTTWTTIVSNTGNTGTWYSNYHLLGSTAYSYRVSAINSVGTSSPSNTASATTLAPIAPQPPTGLATPYVSSSQISISWQAPLNDGGSPITGYKIESSTDGGTTWNIIVANTGLPGTWYSNYHLLGSTAYSYRVSTINGIGTGTPSTTVSATTSPPTAPHLPSGLASPSVSSSQISISWFAPSNNGGSPITGYKIESSTDGGTNWNIVAANTGSTGTWYSNYNLLAGT